MARTKIELGDEIEDVVTKIRGIAHGRITYLDGAVVWIVQPPPLEGAEISKEVYCQDAYVKYVGEGVRTKAKPAMGFNARNESS